jgi:hypothetical protein
MKPRLDAEFLILNHEARISWARFLSTGVRAASGSSTGRPMSMVPRCSPRVTLSQCSGSAELPRTHSQIVTTETIYVAIEKQDSLFPLDTLYFRYTNLEY